MSPSLSADMRTGCGLNDDVRLMTVGEVGTKGEQRMRQFEPTHTHQMTRRLSILDKRTGSRHGVQLVVGCKYVNTAGSAFPPEG